MIVQCPSCTTRFAVDDNQLQGVDTPKFHCSRCDHFFEHLNAGESTSSADNSEMTSEVAADESATAADSAATFSINEPAALTASSEMPTYLNSTPAPEELSRSTVSLSPVLAAKISAAKSVQPKQLDLLPVSETKRVAPPPFRRTPFGSEYRFPRVNIDEISEGVSVSWPDSSTDTQVEADLRDVLVALRSAPFGNGHPEETNGQPSSETVNGNGSAYRNGTSLYSALASASAESLGISWPINPVKIEPEHEVQSESFSVSSQPDEVNLDSDRSDSDWTIGSYNSSSFDSSSSNETSPIATEVAPNALLSEPIPALEAEASPPKAEIVTASVFQFPRRQSAEGTFTDQRPDQNPSQNPVVEKAGRDAALLKVAKQLLSIPRSTVASGLSGAVADKFIAPLVPVLLATLLPIAFCLIFAVWAANVEKTPVIISSMLFSPPTDAARAAPEGVDLSDLRSEVVTLDDGNQVLQISGTVVNNTPVVYKTVSIEAKSYNQNNEVLQEALVNSNNGLLTTQQIKTLKEDALAALQSRPGIIGHQLKPNGRFPFRLILNAKATGGQSLSQGELASWFSARVFSVEQVNGLS